LDFKVRWELKHKKSQVEPITPLRNTHTFTNTSQEDLYELCLTIEKHPIPRYSWDLALAAPACSQLGLQFLKNHRRRGLVSLGHPRYGHTRNASTEKKSRLLQKHPHF
jgi:hypothetical protein